MRKFSKIVRWVVATLFIALAAYCVLRGGYTRARENGLWLVFMFLVFAALAAGFKPLYAKILRRPPPRAVFISLLALCLAVKLAWVLAFRIEPHGDYRTFYLAASGLAENFRISPDSYLPHYIAMFPHIFGYASFLGLLYKIAGTDSALLAAVVNVLLSVFSAACIYYICLKLFSRDAAVLGSLIWTAFPSQTIYNMFVLSEPYYTALLLLFFCIPVYAESKMRTAPSWERLILIVFAAAVLALINSVRPIAPVLLIALAIWLFIVEPYDRGKKELLSRVIGFILLLAVYFTGTALNSRLVESGIGEEPSSLPGYSVLVGFNTESGGTWNAEDNTLFESRMADSDPFSAQEVQERLFGDAMERMKAGGIGPYFFEKKLLTFLGCDNMAVVYADSALPHINGPSAVCNAYYYLVWIFAAIGAVYALHRDRLGIPVLMLLFVIGLTAAQMLVEVAPRYHYSIAAVLSIMAGVGLSESFYRRGKLNLRF